MDIPALVAALITAIYTFILTLVITVVQVLSWPMNTLITQGFPGIGSILSDMATSLTGLLVYMAYILSFLPPFVLPFILLLLGVELALVLLFQGTYVFTKVWFIVQKIKFW